MLTERMSKFMRRGSCWNAKRLSLGTCLILDLDWIATNRAEYTTSKERVKAYESNSFDLAEEV